jgi:class 3 adenylate cyclase
VGPHIGSLPEWAGRRRTPDRWARYVAQDRREAIALGRPIEDDATGVALMVDIAGFTRLGEKLTARMGPWRGTRQLANTVDALCEVLIREIERHGASVVEFAGDAMTCWFARIDRTLPAAARALACADSLQRSAKGARGVSIKVAISSGRARRLVVGDPSIQLFDVLAGDAVSRLSAAQERARAGDIVADSRTLDDIRASVPGVVDVLAWRSDDSGGSPIASITARRACLAPIESAHVAVPLRRDQLAPWLHPNALLRDGGEVGRVDTTLEPTVSLFLTLRGIDFDADPRCQERLDRAVRCVQAVAQRENGVLTQVTMSEKGGYAYVCFGTSGARDDDAARAASAAESLHRELAAFEFLEPTRIGIGEGVSRVGPYGSSTRAAYGALGAGANRACRLMARAYPGQTLVFLGSQQDACSTLLAEPERIRSRPRYDRRLSERHVQARSWSMRPGHVGGTTRP